jgi:branched-chain amino acid transport system permease protein
VSSSAKTGDPVIPVFSTEHYRFQNQTSVITGSPAFAGDDNSDVMTPLQYVQFKRMWSIYLNVVIEGVLTGFVYGLMALGLSVIFGVVRVVNFAHGEFAVAAMYAAWGLFTAFHVDPLLALAPLAAVFFVIGYVLQMTLINPFVGRPDHQQFILLVGVGLIIVNGLLMRFGPDAQPVNLPYGFDSYEIASIGGQPLLVDKPRVYAASAAIAVAGALFWFFRCTRTGAAIRACADNLTGAAVVGLDVRRLYALTFGLGLACVGAAGALLVTIADPAPSLGPAYTLLAFIIVIIGGMGSMTGPLAGGVLIGVSEALAGFLFAPSMKSMFSFALLIAVLVVRPQGLMGRRP